VSAFFLIQGATAAQAPLSSTNQPKIVAYPGGGAGAAVVGATGPSFQVVVSSPTGASVGGSVRIWVSNDYNPSANTGNWSDYNTISPVGLAQGVPNQVSTVIGSGSFVAFAATVSTITGTGAVINVTMSA
jgi:hypothetical protein